MISSHFAIHQKGIRAKGAPPAYHADFYPYGGEHDYVNTCAQNYKFTGKERDPETNNDDFDARYYASAYGRFLSADWSSTPAPVPYANLTNPQTLNLYATVSDNPESFADLDGHQNFTQSNVLPGACTDSGTSACAQQTATQDQEQHGWLWRFAHSLGIVHTAAESAAIRHQEDLDIIRMLRIKIKSVNGNQLDPATMSSEDLERAIDQWGRTQCCIGNGNSGMLGASGTQTISHTLWERAGSRIDVENPHPGQRPDQIHFQDADGNTYVYDTSTRSFRGAPTQ